MSVKRPQVATPTRPKRIASHRSMALAAIALLFLFTQQTSIAQPRHSIASTMQAMRPEPADEGPAASDRLPMPVDPPQTIADPEREFALKLLESEEQGLKLAEAHAATATDAQMREIARDVAAARRTEIARLRAWLANRKVRIHPPRMLQRQH